jgi:putative hemolysin
MNYSNFIMPAPEFPAFSMNDIIAAPDIQLLNAEINQLLSTHVILRTQPYALIVCDLDGRPAMRQELGRQREITFRLAGESSGDAFDIDRYDDYYRQLIIWDESAGRLVGGYRFGCGDSIFSAFGKAGFYIHSLFHIDDAFNIYLPQCLELGRSFIVPSYQKKHLPLYLLWKGIFAFQLRHPQYKYLIGPVSISRYYSEFSRKVIMDFATRNFIHREFSGWFRPRTPYDPAIDMNEVAHEFNLDHVDMENIIDQIRPEHIRFPVLMKQYIRQNARFLGFNLDPSFNEALDGLMILDMADVPLQTIEMLKREL